MLSRSKTGTVKSPRLMVRAMTPIDPAREWPFYHGDVGFGPCPNASPLVLRNLVSSPVEARESTALRWGKRPKRATIFLWRVHPSMLRST
jgi:hypothetical protein